MELNQELQLCSNYMQFLDIVSFIGKNITLSVNFAFTFL